jgi:uncharacterized membrane protein
MDVGPVEYLVISFPGNHFDGSVAPAIADLVERGTVHILDLVFIKKDPDGDVTIFEFNDLEEAIGFVDIEGEAEGILNDDDIAAVADGLEPDSSALFILWEDLWALDLAQAVRRAGGQVVAGARIPREIIESAFVGIDTDGEVTS